MARTVIVYSNYCMKCVNRTKWKELKDFCAKHRMLLEERRTNYEKKYKREAEEFSDLLPIIVLEDRYVEIGEPLRHLL